MAAMICENSLQSILDNIDSLCVPNTNKRQELANCIKEYFDHSIQESTEYGDISELIVNEIDSESIWEQVQTRCRPLLRHLEAQLVLLNKKLKEKPMKMELIQDTTAKKSSKIQDNDDSQSSSAQSESELESGSDSESESEVAAVSDSQGSDEEGEDSESNDSVGSNNSETENGNESFIDQDDMDQFLDEIDLAEERRLAELENPTSNGERTSTPLDFETDMDLVANELYELSDETEDEEDLRYEDFFGPKSKSKKSHSKSKNKTVESDKGFDEENEDDEDDDEDMFEDGKDDYDELEDGDDSDNDDDDGDEDGEQEQESKVKAATTTYEKEKQKMQLRIAEYENQLMEEKSWERKGEVKSGDRPENSLLGLAVAIERASKSTPIITPEYSKTIEDMIIEKIKSSNFSNIVPQQTSRVSSTQALPELSQEKSHLGLGELYAQQFMKESLHFDKTDEKLKESREKVVAQFKKVCRQLDGLSHFYFAPKPDVQEFIVKPMAVSSISLEDILPTTSSSSFSSLAPEQIHEKKRGRDAAFLTTGEADRDDRKRLRRAKKAVRNKSRKAEAIQQQQQSQGQGGDQIMSKIKDKRVTIIDHHHPKSSSASSAATASSTKSTKTFSKSAKFFSELQKNVSAGVGMKKKSLNEEKTATSQTLKL